MRRPTLPSAALAASFCVFALLALAGWAASSLDRRSAGEALAGSALRMDIEQLVDHASNVIEGRVIALSVELDGLGRPCTRATISVDRDFVGQASGSFDLRWPGGVLPSGDGMVIAGMPRAAVGEEVVLFLTEESSAGLRLPVGLAQGKFRVVHSVGGAKRLVREHADLELIDPHSARSQHVDASASLDYAETVARLEAAAARKQRAATKPEGGR